MGAATSQRLQAVQQEVRQQVGRLAATAAAAFAAAAELTAGPQPVAAQLQGLGRGLAAVRRLSAQPLLPQLDAAVVVRLKQILDAARAAAEALDGALSQLDPGDNGQASRALAWAARVAVLGTSAARGTAAALVEQQASSAGRPTELLPPFLYPRVTALVDALLRNSTVGSC